MSHQLTATILQEMLDEDTKREMHKFKRLQDTKAPGLSPADISLKKSDELYSVLAAPLKKIQAAYLLDVSKNCYPAKYMDDSMPNAEQVKLCRLDKREKYWGKFDDKLRNVRDSNMFKYQECIDDANNNIIKSIECMRAYNARMDVDNVTLSNFVHSEYAKYC